MSNSIFLSVFTDILKTMYLIFSYDSVYKSAFDIITCVCNKTKWYHCMQFKKNRPFLLKSEPWGSSVQWSASKKLYYNFVKNKMAIKSCLLFTCTLQHILKFNQIYFFYRYLMPLSDWNRRYKRHQRQLNRLKIRWTQ